MQNNTPEFNIQDTQDKIKKLIRNIEKAIKGNRLQTELILTTLFAKGHILIEDNPGTGKTILSKTLARSITGADHHAADFKRIQFTPDLLPMDLIGSYIFNDQTKEFIFKKGPLFCNVLLADEINRASPKVQSALLECMAENQITIGDMTFPLEKMFFTIATQNPVEMEGTYPLPTAQLDRFFMKIHFGYVDEETELSIYNEYLAIEESQAHVDEVLTMNEILQLQEYAKNIFIHPEIVRSVKNMIVATRNNPDIVLGASTRSGITLIKCLKAYAMIKGRDFVNEDDLQQISSYVLNHRIIYRSKELSKILSDKFLEIELERLGKLSINA